MLKENRTQTLIKIGTEEATTFFNAPTSQDKESYDGNISEVDEEMMHRWKVSNQLGLTHSQTMKAKKRPTRRMKTKLQNLQIRNQSKNVATGHHLDLEMVQLVTTRTFSPRVERPSIPQTIFSFITFGELAGYFS